MRNFKVEVCVDNIESALKAQEAGADRIELCTGLPEGGTTPGMGTISYLRKNLSIGINVIIRPRGGDFLYSESEFEVMKRDIDACGACGANGVVLGLLRADGSINIERTSVLIERARPMSVTFHRAFDLCSDPYKGLEDLISAGADRLLTSGQKNKVVDGLELIAQLVKQAADRIIIMPGSGINNSNIADIAAATKAHEFHLTGRKETDSKMLFRINDISMGGDPAISEYSRKITDPDLIKDIIRKLT